MSVTAPVAAFSLADAETRPDPGPGFRLSDSVDGGVRKFAHGAPRAATFAHLSGQICISLNNQSDFADIPPDLHCHAQAALRRVSMDDSVEKASVSGRESLRRPSGQW